MLSLGYSSLCVNKCHILEEDTRKQKYAYEINDVKLESVQCAKDRGISITLNLNFSQQCKDAVSKAKRMPAFINRNFSFRNKDITPPLYIRLVRSRLEHAVQFHTSCSVCLYLIATTCPGIHYRHTKKKIYIYYSCVSKTSKRYPRRDK